MSTIDRLINWAEAKQLAIDVHFVKGTVRIDRHRFKNFDDAFAWATKFSANWGLSAP
jgi:hypothetical protein